MHICCYAKYRIRDINTPVCVSSVTGEATFYNRGTGSTLEKVVVDETIKNHHVSYEEGQIPLETLADICKRFVNGKGIHLLKIDTEFHERQVLEVDDVTQWQPWALCIEATFPHTDIPVHKKWEDKIPNIYIEYKIEDKHNKYYIRRDKWDQSLMGKNKLDPIQPIKGLLPSPSAEK